MTNRYLHLKALSTLILLVLMTRGHAQTIDAFDPKADDAVWAVCLLPNGKMIVGGIFLNMGGVPRSHIARLNADGTLDSTFNPGADGDVCCLALQEDGKILVGGYFTNLGGQPRAHLARLNADGSLDLTFAVDTDDTVFCIALDPAGRTLVGGMFTEVAGQHRTCIARLNADGILDSAMSPEVSEYSGSDAPIILTMAIQPDGKVLVGGYFAALGGHTNYGIGRLYENGTVDANFSPANDWCAYAFTVQPDSKILVAGGFGMLCGQPRCAIGRLNSDGALDTTFNPATSIPIGYASIGLQADGKMTCGGMGDPDTPGVRQIVRFDQQGSVDQTLSATADSDVEGLALQADGKIVVNGYFTNLSGTARLRLARLNNTGTAPQRLSMQNSTITWTRGGTSPECWRTSFDFTTNNGVDWTRAGAGVRRAGGWELTGVSLPTNALIRARGFVAGGSANASSWYVESMLGPCTPPVLFRNADGPASDPFGFSIQAGIGRLVTVQASTDLVNWVSVSTNTMSAETISFVDPTAANYPARFYRALSQ
jgi:uncharacterized delta-60 repeat protein